VSERAGYREAMDRMTKQLRESGMSADKARQVAQDTARKADQKQTDKGR
jgi:hypothetical protein